jgi:hypothetical protein
MPKHLRYLSIYILTIVFLTSCKKEEEPIPEDIFVGQYLLQEVLDEYNPTDPNREEDKFLAPELFRITKSDFFNPVTGETISSYKFLIDSVFIGISEKTDSNGSILVGVQSCTSVEDVLNSASITLLENEQYRLNMFNCVGREVLADYSRSPIVE